MSSGHASTGSFPPLTFYLHSTLSFYFVTRFLVGQRDLVTHFSFRVEANDIALSEHTGTHVDAPVHTWETGIHIDEISLGNLIGPAIVINITQKSLQDPNYKIAVQDLNGNSTMQ